MKILMIGEAANHADTLAAALDEGWTIEALPREAASSDAFDARIAADDVVISLRFSREGGAPAFRLLHVPGAGLDGIDLDALSPETAVCNVFEHEIPIAEFVLCQLLEWEIGISAMRAGFSPEAWPDLYRARVPHGEIHGRMLGLIGYGRIGRAIAARASAFGMRVIAVDAAPGERGPAEAVLPPDRLAEMLGAADAVVICCPLTPATRELVGAEALAAMKPTARLLNVSRAEVADEDALFDALEAGRIAGAALDVWWSYPAGSDDRPAPSRRPFHSLPNVVCTPHSSAWTRELPRRRYGVIAENIRRLRGGEPLQNLVRPGAKAERRSG